MIGKGCRMKRAWPILRYHPGILQEALSKTQIQINNILEYKVVQIWPGQTVTCLHTNSPGPIWTTLYLSVEYWGKSLAQCKMKMDPGESEWITNWVS
jgi:hypothetical protein